MKLGEDNIIESMNTRAEKLVHVLVSNPIVL